MVINFRLVLAAILAGGLLPGADTTGSVRGGIVDPSGAPIPSARIELINADTSVSYRQSSNGEGRYLFNLVPPGNYNIRASRDGFRTHTLTGLVVEVNKSLLVNLQLEIGTVSESIEVKADTNQIEVASARVATNVERKYLVELPSGSRNALAVAEMAPGVNLIRPDSQVTNIEGSAANVNGLRRSSNVYYLDGSDNTGTFRNTSLQMPNPEAVQEVQVSTASTSAEFGKQPGGVFNVITKSGTNQFHGAGFYFFRNAALNANSWDRNRTGTARPPDNQKQYGGTLGGPIRRDRTFFFASYMQHRDNNPGFQNNRQFPTTAALRGDLSAFTRPLYDPDTGAPLPNNQIPARLLDPVAQNLLKLVPTVSNFGDRFVYEYQDDQVNNEILGKIDHVFSERHQVQGSYLRTFGTGKLYGQNGNEIPTWAPQVNDSEQHTVSARHTWMLRPTILIENRFALARHIADRRNANLGRDLSDFGAKWPIPQQGMQKTLPQITVSDGFNGRIGALSYFDQKNYRIGSSLNWQRVKSNWKFGGEAQKSGVRQLADQLASAFNFDGRSSSTPAAGRPGGVGVFGYSLADLLMGRSSAFNTSGLRDYDIYAWSYYFFAQNEWRVNRRLTLTPGFRYEFYTPPAEHNARASGFVFGNRSSLYPSAPLHMAFQGDASVPRGFFRQDRNNFAPRLGAAWDVHGDGRMAVRAGIGLYYAYNVMNMPMWNSERTPWNASAAGGETRSLVDPWGTSRTVVYSQPPTPFSSDISRFSYPPRIASMIWYDQGFTTPYTSQWNLSIERQFFTGISAQVSYVANRGIGFFQILDGNLPQWAANASLTNVENRRPIAGYGLIENLHSRARSWHDSFQLATDIRRVKGLNTRFTYVYGKTTAVVEEDRGQGGSRPSNPLNVDGEKAEVGNRHTARLFALYEMPFLATNQGLLGRTLGGWQLSGTMAAFSGTKLDVILGEDWNFDGQPGDRPDVTAPLRYLDGTKDQKMAAYFDTSIFVNPAIRNTFGNLGRNAVFGPGSFTASLAALKNFRFGEQRYFQFRAEAYNFLNNNNLADPVTQRSSRDFGRILNRFGNRTMQLGLRFVF